MDKNTKSLTKLDPRITKFQNKLRAKYAEQNKTVEPNQIDFVGSSLMEIFPVAKIQKKFKPDLSKKIYNRGIRATTTQDVLNHLDTLIFALKPAKIFINIGSNDIGFKVPKETFLNNYKNILEKIKQKLPNTKIYVMAYYPMASSGVDFDDRSNHDLQIANQEIQTLAKETGNYFINVNDGLTDKDGNLLSKYTFDGAHMSANGYEVVFKNLLPYLE